MSCRSALEFVLFSTIAVASAASSAHAQSREHQPFPLEASGLDPATGESVLVASAGAIEALRDANALTLGPVLLPDGRSIDLIVDWIDMARFGFVISVDGVPAPGLLDDVGLSLWTGKVAGDPSSSVILAFSRFGSRGWIEQAEETYHLQADPGPRGDWSRSRSRWRLESESGAVVGGPGDLCGTSALAGLAPPRSKSSIGGSGSSATLVCTIAIECDYQLYTRFNDISAETSYVTALLGAVSARYEEQLDVVLTFPYLNLWTTPNDPWQTQEIGGNACALLFEFRNAWAGNIPAGANLAHMLSGANLSAYGAAGCAFLNVLCDPTLGFGVSGDLTATGFTPFPVVQGPLTLDFYLVAHELGHNFGAPHTHEECPPLDECAPPGFFGPCQSAQVCTNQGTIMSYCVNCPGFMNNVTTYFHTAQLPGMRAAAENSCLQPYSQGNFVELLPIGAAAYDYFGSSISLSGNRALVGAPNADDIGPDSGSAHLFERQPSGTWIPMAKLRPSDGAAYDYFGLVSLSGDRALIGAVQDDDRGIDSGSAYVFERGSSGVWIQAAKLLAIDGAAFDYLGYPTSLSGDRALVGAIGDDDLGPDTGAAYVFERQSNGVWIQAAKLLASDGGGYDYFASSVSLVGDRALVGAIGDDDLGPDTGAAYVFERQSNGMWTQTAKLLASDGGGLDNFGLSVSLSGDQALVGAPYDDDLGPDTGAAYVFERQSGGSWIETKKLLASDGGGLDNFGLSVSLSGSQALVGSPLDDDSGIDAGAVYLFEQPPGGAWVEIAKLLATGEGAPSDWLGYSVSLSGNQALAGAVFDDDTGLDAGAAYVFTPSVGSVRLAPGIRATR